jgi:hypothetical protein
VVAGDGSTPFVAIPSDSAREELAETVLHQSVLAQLA